MDYLLSILLSYLLLYKYAAIAVIVFLSGLILPLPSNTLLLAAGAFASQGYMSATAIFLAALIANVLGDSLGYMLTRVWRTRIITEGMLKRFASLGRIEGFVKQHARLTIVVTRFFGTPGSIVNFLCGLSGVPYGRFLLYDAIGNALDTACFVATGYALGVYSESFSDIAQLAGWIALVALLIFFIARFFIRRNASASTRA